jgi:hypothetical protein
MESTPFAGTSGDILEVDVRRGQELCTRSNTKEDSP